jgi:hypothetical protein
MYLKNMAENYDWKLIYKLYRSTGTRRLVRCSQLYRNVEGERGTRVQLRFCEECMAATLAKSTIILRGRLWPLPQKKKKKRNRNGTIYRSYIHIYIYNLGASVVLYRLINSSTAQYGKSYHSTPHTNILHTQYVTCKMYNCITNLKTANKIISCWCYILRRYLSLNDVRKVLSVKFVRDYTDFNYLFPKHCSSYKHRSCIPTAANVRHLYTAVNNFTF